MSVATDYYRSKRDNLYYYRLATPPLRRSRRNPRPRGVCTGFATLAEARQAVMETGVAKLAILMKHGALIEEATKILNRENIRSCSEAVAGWNVWLEVAVAASSQQTYNQQVKQMFDYHQMWDAPVPNLTENKLDEWVNSGFATWGARSARLAAARSFFRWTQAKGFTPNNPATLVSIRHREMTIDLLEKREVFPFTPEEYEKLLAGLKGHLRDWTILSYCVGYRLVDCVRLEYESIRENELLIYPRKTGRRLVIPLTDPLYARPELLELLARLRAAQREGQTHVFSKQYLYSVMRGHHQLFSIQYGQEMKRLELSQRSFHSLRRSFARRLRAAGKSVEEIAARMGHANILTTQLYLDER